LVAASRAGKATSGIGGNVNYAFGKTNLAGFWRSRLNQAIRPVRRDAQKILW